jgi:hypothetical protein
MENEYMSNVNRIRKYYGTMDKGEKAYMANKLWAEDRVVAAKIKGYVPDEVLNPVQPVTYTRGQKFVHCGETYILASCDADTMALISVRDGNRWTDAVDVNLCSRVSAAEFQLITENTQFQEVA